MVYPDKISVYHRLRNPPSSSDSNFSLDCIVLSHQHRRIAARLEEDIVVYDYRAARKAAMPGFMVDLFDQTYRQQVEETVRARTRIWELVGAVESPEKETWDREGATEDLGSAAGGSGGGSK